MSSQQADLQLVTTILLSLPAAERVALGRFLALIDLRQDDDCWRWTGELTPNGYGRFCARGQRTMAHRWLYERLVAAIPAGLVLDHLCRNRACVRPGHLEPVTNAENVRRGMIASRTACPYGHRYTPENTRHYRGRRYCRACNNNGGRGRYEILAKELLDT